MTARRIVVAVLALASLTVGMYAQGGGGGAQGAAGRRAGRRRRCVAAAVAAGVRLVRRGRATS